MLQIKNMNKFNIKTRMFKSKILVIHHRKPLLHALQSLNMNSEILESFAIFSRYNSNTQCISVRKEEFASLGLLLFSTRFLRTCLLKFHQKITSMENITSIGDHENMLDEGLLYREKRSPRLENSHLDLRRSL